VRKLRIRGIFLRLCEKSMDQNETKTLSASWYGKAMYQISNEYLKARKKKKAEN
jgi:hypothetical protein